jgi:epoxyqueuosine reductase
MSYLADHFHLRVDPAALLPGAKSVICVADRYPRPVRGLPAGDREGQIAAYAKGRDYHTVIKKRLHAICDELQVACPGETFRACVDTAPILERELAAAAGLGSIGKHTLLIEPSIGSWMLLGGIVTTVDLGAHVTPPMDVCGTCTRCIDACPTDALTPFEIDATRCISYLTIEHRPLIDPALHRGMGEWIFGCDICQDVCPHGQPTQKTISADVQNAYEPKVLSLDLLEVLGWTSEDRQRVFAGTAMKRATLDMMRRNAIIAAGNALEEEGDGRLTARLHEIADDLDEPEMVRQTARDVLNRLEGA